MTPSHIPPDLTDSEIADICRPLKQPAAQAKYLKRELGLYVSRRPDGTVLVNRQHYDAVRGHARQEAVR